MDGDIVTGGGPMQMYLKGGIMIGVLVAYVVGLILLSELFLIDFVAKDVPHGVRSSLAVAGIIGAAVLMLKLGSFFFGKKISDLKHQ